MEDHRPTIDFEKSQKFTWVSIGKDGLARLAAAKAASAAAAAATAGAPAAGDVPAPGSVATPRKHSSKVSPGFSCGAGGGGGGAGGAGGGGGGGGGAQTGALGGGDAAALAEINSKIGTDQSWQSLGGDALQRWIQENGVHGVHTRYLF